MGVGTQIANFIYNIFNSNSSTPFSTDMKIIEFEVTKEEFKEITRKWLIENPLIPEDFNETMDTFNFFGVYMPLYLYKGNYTSRIVVRHYDEETKKWHNEPHEPISGNFVELVVATNLTNRNWKYWLSLPFFYLNIQKFLPTFLIPEFVSNFDNSLSFLDPNLKFSKIISYCEYLRNWVYIEHKIKDFDENFVKDYTILPFSISMKIAESKIKKRINGMINTEKNEMFFVLGNALIPYLNYSVKSFKPSINYEKMLKIYLPFWFATFSYNHKKYYYVGDGQDHSRKGKGKTPRDAKKTLIFSVYLICFSLVLVSILISLFLIENVSWKILIVVFSIIFGVITWIKYNGYLTNVKERQDKSLSSVEQFDDDTSQKSEELNNHEQLLEKEDDIMNDGTIFSISSQTAETINNIVGNLNITHNSSADDVLKIIEAIQHNVGELDIGEKEKRKISNHLDNVKIDLEEKEPDKSSIGESIKSVNGILKDAKASSETLKDIGIWVGKVATWLGTTSVKLGWIF